MVYEIRTGRLAPLRSPDEAAAHPLFEAAQARPSNRVAGGPAAAVEALDALVAATGADEVMISTVAYDLATRMRSLELLASAWSEAIIPA